MKKYLLISLVSLSFYNNTDNKPSQQRPNILKNMFENLQKDSSIYFDQDLKLCVQAASDKSTACITKEELYGLLCIALITLESPKNIPDSKEFFELLSAFQKSKISKTNTSFTASVQGSPVINEEQVTVNINANVTLEPVKKSK